jgi:serine/threonine-protein kinase HipA
MPLIVKEHGHRVVEAFLWGLLPDNDAVLSRWGRRFRVSPRNPFRLIEHVGEDCAGAVQFARPDRLENLLAEGTEVS